MTQSLRSPEETGAFFCPCGNKTEFTGLDARGFPGFGECECGYMDEDGEKAGEVAECTCTTLLEQDFEVVRHAGGWEVNYHEFYGGGSGAEIGDYTKIVCRACGQTLWEDPEHARLAGEDST